MLKRALEAKDPIQIFFFSFGCCQIYFVTFIPSIDLCSLASSPVKWASVSLPHRASKRIKLNNAGLVSNAQQNAQQVSMSYLFSYTQRLTLQKIIGNLFCFIFLPLPLWFLLEILKIYLIFTLFCVCILISDLPLSIHFSPSSILPLSGSADDIQNITEH